MSTIDLDEFYEYYSSGVPITALSKHYGITRKEVFRHVYENGWRDKVIHSFQSKPRWSLYLVRRAIAKILSVKQKRIRAAKTQEQKEQFTLYLRAYYERKRKDPEYLKRMNERAKARYRSKKKEILKYAKQWRDKNPGKMKEYAKLWYKNNKPQAKANSDKRRATLVGATIGNTRLIARWERAWKKKPSVNCYWCSRSFKPSKCHSDHVQPLSKNGTHEIGNLCISCALCNARKHAKPISEWNKAIDQPVLL